MTKTKHQAKRTTQVEKINQKILAKEGRLKRYRERVKQNRTFQNNERKFYLQDGGECMRTFQQPDAKEATQSE